MLSDTLTTFCPDFLSLVAVQPFKAKIIKCWMILANILDLPASFFFFCNLGVKIGGTYSVSGLHAIPVFFLLVSCWTPETVSTFKAFQFLLSESITWLINTMNSFRSFLWCCVPPWPTMLVAFKMPRWRLKRRLVQIRNPGPLFKTLAKPGLSWLWTLEKNHDRTLAFVLYSSWWSGGRDQVFHLYLT